MLAFFSTLINVSYISFFFVHNGYLPSPFIYDKWDTFMDFFNPLFWVDLPGIYTEWQSVYPPLNFIILKLYKEFLFLEFTNYLNSFELRALLENDIKYIVLSYAMILIISVEIIFKDIALLQVRVLICISTLFSSYFLFGLERGNLIIISLLVLAIYINAKTELGKALSFAILVNLKPYFLIIYLVRLLDYKNTANNHFLFLAPLLSALIFILTGLILGQEYYMLPLNILGFASKKGLLSPTEVLTLPTSITAISYLVKIIVEFKVPSIVSLAVKLAVFFYLFKLLKLAFEKKCSTNDLSIIAIIFITNYSVSSGPYAMLFYLAVIGILYRIKEFQLLLLITIMLYGGILDLIPIYHYKDDMQNVYLSGELIEIESYLTLGTVVRPVINFIFLILYIQRITKLEPKP